MAMRPPTIPFVSIRVESESSNATSVEMTCRFRAAIEDRFAISRRARAFSIAVVAVSNGSATLSWNAPTLNTDGSALTNLAGYRIVYGTSASNLSQTIQLSNPGLTSYAIENLAPGTYYFAVRAFTSSAESQLSNTASKIIQ